VPLASEGVLAKHAGLVFITGHRRKIHFVVQSRSQVTATRRSGAVKVCYTWHVKAFSLRCLRNENLPTSLHDVSRHQAGARETAAPLSRFWAPEFQCLRIPQVKVAVLTVHVSNIAELGDLYSGASKW